MPAPAAVRRRVLRALTFAVVLLASACVAHWVAGGMLPGPGVLGGCLIALVAIGWLLAHRDRSTAAVAGVAAVGQLGLHLTFSLSMRSAGMPSMASMLCGNTSAPTPAGVVTMHAAGAYPLGVEMAAMMAAHAVGGVLALLALRRAESAAALVVALLTAVLRLLTPPVARVRVTVRAPAAPAPVVGATSSFSIRTAPRRGPPALVCL